MHLDRHNKAPFCPKEMLNFKLKLKRKSFRFGNYFWSIKNSNDVLKKFKSKNFQASKLSTYDFSTLYTTLPHHLIKDKLIDLINRTFIRENTQYLACNEECAFYSVIIKAGSKGRESGPKVGSKFGQSNNNT